MGAFLSGVKIAVLGGDDRELVYIPELLRLGAEVKVAGYPPRPELTGVQVVDSLPEAIEGAEVLLLPMPGTDGQGVIRAVYSPHKLVLSEQIISKIPRSVPTLIGVAKPFLKDIFSRHRLRLVEIAELDDISILNAIPTAEAAIQIAMQELPITIHSSQAMVLGFGRVGQNMAPRRGRAGPRKLFLARKARISPNANEHDIISAVR
jgi:dipicolinate synthase subunit A